MIIYFQGRYRKLSKSREHMSWHKGLQVVSTHEAVVTKLCSEITDFHSSVNNAWRMSAKSIAVSFQPISWSHGNLVHVVMFIIFH
jgi:hypothetical protein